MPTATNGTDGKPTKEELAYCHARHPSLNDEMLDLYAETLCKKKRDYGLPLVQTSPAAA